jgi:hypothetical protein
LRSVPPKIQAPAGVATFENLPRRNLPLLTELKNILIFRCNKYAEPLALGRRRVPPLQFFCYFVANIVFSKYEWL